MYHVEIGTINNIEAVEISIPEFQRRITIDDLNERLTGKKSLILVVNVDNKVIAYKVGYELTKNTFYSWIGGVIPKYRKQGIATLLRNHQEQWAIENGYDTIKVKSMNRYPAMLQLLISSDYHISGYEDNGSIHTSKIQFSKSLYNEHMRH